MDSSTQSADVGHDPPRLQGSHDDPIDAAELLDANARIRAAVRQNIAAARQLRVDAELTRTEAEIARVETQIDRAPDSAAGTGLDS